MTSSEKIQFYRSKKGLTQDDLGQLCFPNYKVPHAKVSKIESGLQNPKQEELRIIAKALEIPVSELMDETGLGDVEHAAVGAEAPGSLVQCYPLLKDHVEIVNLTARLENEGLLRSAVREMCSYLKDAKPEKFSGKEPRPVTLHRWAAENYPKLGHYLGLAGVAARVGKTDFMKNCIEEMCKYLAK